MIVHFNFLLPLITHSVVEFPNGDEVPTNLVYERLDKHCSKCLRLDHDIKECLVACAEAKALKVAHEEAQERTDLSSNQGSGSIRGISAAPVHDNRPHNEKEFTNHDTFQILSGP